MVIKTDFSSGWEANYQKQTEGAAWSGMPHPGVIDFVNAMKPASLILDLGCGDGRNSIVAAEAGHQVVLLDIAATALQLALRNFETAGHRAVAFKASMEDLPLASNHFDEILCLDALIQLSRPELAISEIHRVLRPGGRTFVNVLTPQDCSWGEGEQVGPSSWSYRSTLFTFWERGDLEQMCGDRFQVTHANRLRWTDPPHIPFRPYEHEHDAIFYTLTKR